MIRNLSLSLTRQALLGAASVGALVFATPQSALAQDEGASGGFDEIVVSAQRREQSAQDVPIKIGRAHV